jgi:hypothetical protein
MPRYWRCRLKSSRTDQRKPFGCAQTACTPRLTRQSSAMVRERYDEDRTRSRADGPDRGTVEARTRSSAVVPDATRPRGPRGAPCTRESPHGSHPRLQGCAPYAFRHVAGQARSLGSLPTVYSSGFMPTPEQDAKLRLHIETLLARIRELAAESSALRAASAELRAQAREVSDRLRWPRAVPSAREPFSN